MRGGLLLLAAALLLAACGDTARRTPSTQPLPEPGPVSEERSRATTADTPKLKESTLRLLASRNLQVQPNRAVHVASQCAHTDDLGTRTRLSLDVNDARVQVFDAEVAIKGRGLCRFALDEFVLRWTNSSRCNGCRRFCFVTNPSRTARCACGKRAPR